MSQDISLRVALDQFNRAADDAIKHSERTYDRFINSRALHVAKKAIEDTDKASADKIAFTLAGNVRTKISVSRKTKKRKTTRQYDVMEGSFAARIVNARLVAAGERPVFGKDLVKKARALIAARLRAVAFVRSGWIFAVKTLARSVGEPGIVTGTARMNGQPKGFANPARPAINSVVTSEIGNTALLSDRAKGVAERGLSAAFQRETREMLAHLAKKLQPVFKQHSAA